MKIAIILYYFLFPSIFVFAQEKKMTCAPKTDSKQIIQVVQKMFNAAATHNLDEYNHFTDSSFYLLDLGAKYSGKDFFENIKKADIEKK